MRSVGFALVCGLVLAACNPGQPAGEGGEGDAQSASASDGSVFPNLFQASYRAEATITGANGQSMPLVMIRSGPRARMEMNGPQGEMATIVNQESGEAFVITTAMGRTMVIRQDINAMENTPDVFWDQATTQAFTQVGPCTHIGEAGLEWSRVRDNGESQNSCVTPDGIILWSTDNGRTTWQTTSVQRGPQDAALFQPPAGAQSLDISNIRDVNDAIEAAKAAANR
ncbi:MAG: hypothetical protein AB7P07_07970 [Hyphomonadaceae bacterium]